MQLKKLKEKSKYLIFLFVSISIHSVMFYEASLTMNIKPGEQDGSHERSKDKANGSSGGDKGKYPQTSHVIYANIIDKGSGQGESSKSNKGYFGIGIDVLNSNNLVNGEIVWGAYVMRVATGYAAENAGIQSGDIILKVNGKPYHDDSITTLDKPQVVYLTIYRNGKILEFVIKTEWISTDGKTN